MNATAGYVITKAHKGGDRRIHQGDRRDGKKREIKIHFPTVLYTSLAWLLLTGAVALVIDARHSWQYSTIATGEAKAPNPVAPGDKLAVIHGITGYCLHTDGGMVIAEARPAAGIEWRLIKRITANPINFEPRGALSKWRIPGHWAPGAYVGRITVWCYGQRRAERSTFNFAVRK